MPSICGKSLKKKYTCNLLAPFVSRILHQAAKLTQSVATAILNYIDIFPPKEGWLSVAVPVTTVSKSKASSLCLSVKEASEIEK